MKILLVNNNTQHLPHLTKSLIDHQVEIVEYQPGVLFNDADKDLVILSGGGGEGFEINDKDQKHPSKLWYEDEMNFILTTKKPVLGICMGFEVICRTYGSQVKEIGRLVEGFKNLRTTAKGKIELSKDNLKQFESHRWQVPEVDTKVFEVLATSNTGIEMIKHKRRPLLASQFHPEKGGTLHLKHLLLASL